MATKGSRFANKRIGGYLMKTAVVLAAGCGEKMWPYCEYWPKAALPVGGVPNIERLTRQLRSLGFGRIIVAAAYL
ncbi:NTP transferase domain-containing protein, partial [Salmonella enterica]|uniref:NTP transferase domain-containing protein n=1 Tax=Salmonella enterica TaxID=28901 RepID=UPI0034DD3F8B